jgi:hypothetical protein
MKNAIVGTWLKVGLKRGGLVALAMAGVVTAGCGGGGGGGSGSDAKASGTNGTSASGNSAPTISATPSAQAAIGAPYTLAPQASDADGDALAFSIQNKPSWAEFSTATGQLSGTPTAQSAGATQDIVITVSDGKASTSLPAFAITVGTTSSTTPTLAGGKSVALSWEVPTVTEDGATLQNLSGYRIHFGTNQNALVNSVEVASSGMNTFTVQNLANGTYFFAVRAVTSTGEESKLSNVISRSIS